jgi:hypothetical protein
MPFIRIFGLINAFVVENVRQQRELEQHAQVSAVLSSDGGLLHRVLASRFAKDMGFSDGELPALEGTSDAAEQGFGADALPIHSGEVYKMATYVAGGDPREDIEVIVQRWVARRFTPRYEATPAVADAARLIGGWHRRGSLTALGSIWGSQLRQAKALIAQSVPPDLHVAYAPTSLLPYIVKCLERMRQLAKDEAISECLSPEMVVAGCLTPPRFVFRTCKADVEVSFTTRPLPANTLVILPARRLRASADDSGAFGSDDVSRYPARRLIQRLLTRVWIASREVHHPAAQSLSAVAARATVQPARARATAQAAYVRDGVTRPGVQPAAPPPVAAHRAQPELEPTVVRPAPVQSVAQAGFEPQPVVPHVVADATLQSAPPGFTSLERTLPFGNDLGKQLSRASERRARKARAKAKAAADRTVPGPF